MRKFDSTSYPARSIIATRRNLLLRIRLDSRTFSMRQTPEPDMMLTLRVTTRAARVRVWQQELFLARDESQLPHCHEEIVEQRAEDAVGQASTGELWTVGWLRLVVASPDAHELQCEQLIVDPVRHFPAITNPKHTQREISSCMAIQC